MGRACVSFGGGWISWPRDKVGSFGWGWEWGGIGFLGVLMWERVVLSDEIMSGVELGWFGQDFGWIGLRRGGDLSWLDCLVG